MMSTDTVTAVGFLRRFLDVTVRPDDFFERVRDEPGWRKPLAHLLALALWMSVASVVAWGLGVQGDSPLNSALGAQMDVYPFWRDTLRPTYGAASYPLAALLIAVEMLVITAVYTPLIYVVFRYLGGARERGGMLRAFQGFVYGLTPAVFGGFLPVVGLVAGVYTTILQLQRGPSITLRNRTIGAYLLWVAVTAYAIARYWQGNLL